MGGRGLGFGGGSSIWIVAMSIDDESGGKGAPASSQSSTESSGPGIA
jgi:hypothetical protein